MRHSNVTISDAFLNSHLSMEKYGILLAKIIPLKELRRRDNERLIVEIVFCFLKNIKMTVETRLKTVFGDIN